MPGGGAGDEGCWGLTGAVGVHVSAGQAVLTELHQAHPLFPRNSSKPRQSAQGGRQDSRARPTRPPGRLHVNSNVKFTPARPAGDVRKAQLWLADLPYKPAGPNAPQRSLCPPPRRQLVRPSARTKYGLLYLVGEKVTGASSRMPAAMTRAARRSPVCALGLPAPTGPGLVTSDSQLWSH